jgi:hypothetical protein
MTKARTGPDCASIGLAQDAFAGVTHSSTFSRLDQRRIAGVLSAARLPMMTDSRHPSGRAARIDGHLQRKINWFRNHLAAS